MTQSDVFAGVMRDGGKSVPPSDEFTRDHRGAYHTPDAPVLQPVSVAEVQEIVRQAARENRTITAQGGNTGMGGGSVPRNANGVIVSTRRMNRIRALCPVGRYVVADAGVTIDEINHAAAEHGLCVAIAFGASGTASVGGVVSTNAGGMNVLRYGMARNHILGLEVVLADGRVWDGLRANRKDNSGPDLKHLFIGTEGTLGFITAACLVLVPVETHSATALLAVRSIADVLRLLMMAQAGGAEHLSRFELISGFCLTGTARDVLDVDMPLKVTSPWYVLVCFASTRDISDVAHGFVERAYSEGIVRDGLLPVSSTQEAELWRLREAIPRLHRRFASYQAFDIAVPIDQLDHLYRQLETDIGAAFPHCRIMCFGHVGDGSLHFSVCNPNAIPDAAEKAAIADCVNRAVWRLAGTISAEHGIGRAHVSELQQQKSALELELSHRLKVIFDPAGMFNPGVIFEDRSQAE